MTQPPAREGAVAAARAGGGEGGGGGAQRPGTTRPRRTHRPRRLISRAAGTDAAGRDGTEGAAPGRPAPDGNGKLIPRAGNRRVPPGRGVGPPRGRGEPGSPLRAGGAG